MKRRIFIAIVAVAAVVVVLFGIPLAYAVQRLYRDEATVRLQQEASAVAQVIPTSPQDAGDPIELPKPGHSITLAIYDATGTMTAGTGPRSLDAADVVALTGRATAIETGGRLVVAVPVIANETVRAVVRAEQPLSVNNGSIHRAWGAMAVLAVLVLAAAATVARVVATRLSRPVRDVHHAAVRLGAGDFTVTVPRSNLTELDDVAAAIETTAARLDRVLQNERTFSADASHQLRTPLTGLRLLLENELAHPDQEPATALRTALGHVDRLEATVTDLLKLARDQPSTSATDLVAMFGEVHDRWNGQAAEVGRALQMSYDGARLVPAPERALHQVLDVLIDNALEHGRGAIRVEARSVDHGVIVSVSDEGSGIRADPDTIFQRRTSSSGSTGIGLALARSLTEAAGGRLTLTRAAPNPEFSVSFPGP